MNKKGIKNIYEDSNLIIGKTIQKCERYLSENDFEDIPESLLSTESDGITYLTLNNELILGFYPHTEKSTISYSTLNKNDVGNTDLINISTNYLIKNILNIPIKGITLLKNEFLIEPYGVRFIFENDKSIELLYLSESEYTFDALVIR